MNLGIEKMNDKTNIATVRSTCYTIELQSMSSAQYEKTEFQVFILGWKRKRLSHKMCTDQDSIGK